MRALIRLWESSLGILRQRPVAGMFALFLPGAIFWGGFNWSRELTNTEAFCTSCHAMREYLYEESKQSFHYANRTGVRASCPDCHVPKEWVHKVVRKVRATNELLSLGDGIDRQPGGVRSEAAGVGAPSLPSRQALFYGHTR